MSVSSCRLIFSPHLLPTDRGILATIYVQVADVSAARGAFEAIYGDELDRPVRWESEGDLGALAGKVVRLRFVLRDADLYSFQFVPYAPDPERPTLP